MVRRLLALAAWIAVTVFPDTAYSGSARDVFVEVYSGIVVVTVQDADDIRMAQGSGVVVGRNEVATNCHVISGASKIKVIQVVDARGHESYLLGATLAARNDERDLCLLHVEELSDPPAAVPVRLGASGAVSIGEEVYAIGAPQGLDLSLTRGIVSQLRNVFGHGSPPLIQTDAAISPGSSGGGLFNGKGELIGITTFKFSGDASEGISFALPTEWVRELVAESRGQTDCFSVPTADCLIAAAIELVEAIEDESSRAEVLHATAFPRAIARAVAKDEAAAKASLANAIVIAGQTEDERWYDSKLVFFATIQTEMGDIDGALNTAAGINNTLRRNDVLVNIAAVQAKAGDIGGALWTANKIVDTHYDRGRSLAAIVTERTKAMDFAGAVLVAKQYKDGFKRGDALNSIASAQANAGDIGGAFQTVEQIDYEFWRYRALAAVAVAQGKSGDEAGAETMFSAAKEVASSLDDTSERAGAMAFIAVSRATMAAEAQDRTKARSMINAAINSVERAGVSLFFEREIAATRAKAGDIEGALESWLCSVSRYDVLESIATALIENGELTEALELSDQVGDLVRRNGLPRRKVCEALLEFKLESSEDGPDIPAGKPRLTLVPVPGQKKKDTNWRVVTLSEIAKAQARAGNLSGALLTSERINEYPRERDALLARISLAQAHTGDLSGAARVVERIADGELRDLSAMGAIMSMMSLEEGVIGGLSSVAGDSVGASELVGHIGDIRMRVVTLAYIAIAVAGATNWTLRKH